MRKFQTLKPVESEQQKIENYSLYEHKNVFLSNQFMEKILKINTKCILKMCKYYCSHVLLFIFILFYVVLE